MMITDPEHYQVALDRGRKLLERLLIFQVIVVLLSLALKVYSFKIDELPNELARSTLAFLCYWGCFHGYHWGRIIMGITSVLGLLGTGIVGFGSAFGLTTNSLEVGIIVLVFILCAVMTWAFLISRSVFFYVDRIKIRREEAMKLLQAAEQRVSGSE